MQLFATAPPARRADVPEEARASAAAARNLRYEAETFLPGVDERTREVYRRAKNPEDPFELRDLWLGRVEHELGDRAHRPWQAERWRDSVVRREVTDEEVLTARSTPRFVKELFNWFFRDDLYGELRESAEVILSSGAVCELDWGLPEALKDCFRYALDRDWYGYSDSCGRLPVREAVAAYESARISGASYTARNVALTLGGTSSVSMLADFILSGRQPAGSPALCCTPNYPPLVEAVARRHPVALVPLPCRDGVTSLRPLLRALTPQTPLVLLQTAANPTGAAVDEAELAELVRAASPSTMILLDECHEWLGEPRTASALRAAPNVIRISSLSKNWSAPGVKAGWVLADAAFISDYYEYASTTIGGPPSFYYTAIEVLARMERWMVTGVSRVGRAEVDEFESSYGLNRDNLQAAYDSYRADRRAREAGLRVLRDAASAQLADVARVTPPSYSINTMVRFDQWDDSYRCFRELLHRSGVSVYPGILNFCFADGVVRVTTARSWRDLSSAFRRLRTALGRKEVACV